MGPADVQKASITSCMPWEGRVWGGVVGQLHFYLKKNTLAARETAQRDPVIDRCGETGGS